jgi:hypothetical protein
MHWPVEVNLRIPSLRVLSEGKQVSINNQQVRFKRRMEFDAVPRAGASITLVAGGYTLPADVLRVEWSESGGAFVADCRYAERRIIAEVYHAIANDTSWVQWSMS